MNGLYNIIKVRKKPRGRKSGMNMKKLIMYMFISGHIKSIELPMIFIYTNIINQRKRYN